MIANRLDPSPLAAVKDGAPTKDPRVVRQSPPCHLKLGAGAIVIAKAVEPILRARHPDIAGLRLQLFRLCDRDVCELAPGRRVVEPAKKDIEVRLSKRAIGKDEARIVADGLIQEAHFVELGAHVRALGTNRHRAGVERVRREIGGRRVRDRCLLFRRNLGAELTGDGLRNLRLDREDVREAAIVALRPEVRVGAGVDQLRVNPYAIARALDAAFEQTGDAKLLADLTRVPGAAGFVEIRRGAADHFQVGNFREIRKDLVLDAGCEIRIFGIRAEILEGQHGDALLGRDRVFRPRRGRRGCAPCRAAMSQREGDAANHRDGDNGCNHEAIAMRCAGVRRRRRNGGEQRRRFVGPFVRIRAS